MVCSGTGIGFAGRNPTVLDGITTGDASYDYPGSGSFIGFIHGRYAITKGMSGSPVLSSSDNSVVGVYTEGRTRSRGGPVGLDLFTSVTKLQHLLRNPILSCLDTSCIRGELQNLRSQAEVGDRQAQYRLGALSSDIKERWIRYEKAAVLGHPNAQFILGRKNYFFSSGDMYWLEKSAAQGHSPAKIFLERISLGVLKPF